MRKVIKGHIEALNNIPTLISDAVMAAKTDEELIDIIGTVKSVERRYKATIRGATVEIVPTADEKVREGEQHKVEVGREAKRSFNTPSLMTMFQDAGFTLIDLIEHDVVRMQWQWSKLMQFATARGLKVEVVEREVTTLKPDDKGAMVGEIWGSTYPKWS